MTTTPKEHCQQPEPEEEELKEEEPDPELYKVLTQGLSQLEQALMGSRVPISDGLYLTKAGYYVGN